MTLPIFAALQPRNDVLFLRHSMADSDMRTANGERVVLVDDLGTGGENDCFRPLCNRNWIVEDRLGDQSELVPTTNQHQLSASSVILCDPLFLHEK